MLRGAHDPVIIDGVTSVLVEGDMGSPLGFASEPILAAMDGGPSGTVVTHILDPDFKRTLKAHGIDRTYVLTTVPKITAASLLKS
jgi:hypothetical protein